LPARWKRAELPIGNTTLSLGRHASVVDDASVVGYRGSFSSGIFDCFSQIFPSCIVAAVCPCFVFARLKATINEPGGCPGPNYHKNLMLYLVSTAAFGAPPFDMLLLCVAVGVNILPSSAPRTGTSPAYPAVPVCDDPRS
jgi:hypothetical protein